MNTSHYPSLELCKKLTEIGFSDTQYVTDGNIILEKTFAFDYSNYYVCPSVMEMLDVMPKSIKMLGIVYYELTEQSWINFTTNNGESIEIDGTYPNALAEMVLYLHENKYLTF